MSKSKKAWQDLVEMEEGRYFRDPEGENGFRNGVEFVRDNIAQLPEVKEIVEHIKDVRSELTSKKQDIDWCIEKLNEALARFEEKEK